MEEKLILCRTKERSFHSSDQGPSSIDSLGVLPPPRGWEIAIVMRIDAVQVAKLAVSQKVVETDVLPAANRNFSKRMLIFQWDSQLVANTFIIG
jgi:hypothetical protein